MTIQCPQAEVEALVLDLVEKGALALERERVVVRDRKLFHQLAELA